MGAQSSGVMNGLDRLPTKSYSMVIVSRGYCILPKGFAT